MSIRTIAAVCAACFMLAPGSGAQIKQGAAPPAPVVELSPSEIFRQSAAQTVTVTAFDAEGNPLSIASGFFLVDGIVVTNLHAVKWASSVVIKPFGSDERLTVESVADFDIAHDLCFFWVERTGHSGIHVESPQQLQVGDPVYVIGNPKGLEGTFSKGMVTAIRESERLIQIDAPISPGSSGGPVLSQRARVIGVATSSVIGGQNLNFATPIDVIKGMHVRASQSYPVEMIGALAITDLEYEHLKGPVRSYLESGAEVGRTGVAPAVTRVRKVFDEAGRQIETGYFKDGAPNGKSLISFDAHGLREHVIEFSPAGQQVDEIPLKPEQRAMLTAAGRSFSEVFDTWDAKNKELDHRKRDARGLETEWECPATSEKWITTYDDQGREKETRVFRTGKLDAVYTYSYETDAYGNWTKRREYIWMSNFADVGSQLNAIDTREIGYFTK